MSDSLWDKKRAQRYLKLYGPPLKKTGTQSLLCSDASTMIMGESVLDFGAGMGHIIPHLKHPQKYVALDYSKTMLTHLHKYFPEIRFLEADATLPFKEFRERLKADGLPIRYDTTLSTSLFIHLPRMADVKRLLRNMWGCCTQAMVFGVETAGDTKIVRGDGLTLRNISLKTMMRLLVEIGVKKVPQHFHQKVCYKQYLTLYPLHAEIVFDPQKDLFTRTTLFRVLK